MSNIINIGTSRDAITSTSSITNKELQHVYLQKTV